MPHNGHAPAAGASGNRDYHQNSETGEKMPEFQLRIDGMHCGSCVKRVTQALSSTEGVEVKEVNIGSARLSSSRVPAPVDAAIAALARAGFSAHLQG
jgi:copper chaperone